MNCHTVIIKDGEGAAQKTAEVNYAKDPEPKDIIYLVMQLHDIPLSVHESCNGVGTDFEDQTIGEFLSGFMAYQSGESKENALEIEVTSDTEKDISDKHWKAVFLIRGNVEDTPFAWGISFVFMDKTKEVVKSSIRCVGSG
jgi:hypothetical protein